MTALDNTPVNPNGFSPLNHKFSIKKAPHVNFFLQKINIPSLDLPPVNTGNPFVKRPEPGDHIEFGQLHLEFQIDEDFQNYLEIQGWLFSLGFPSTFQQYNDLATIPSYTGMGLKSDLSLMILNSSKAPNLEFIFRDAFPIRLSDMVLQTTLTDVQYLVGGASFAYMSYSVNRVT